MCNWRKLWQVGFSASPFTFVTAPSLSLLPGTRVVPLPPARSSIKLVWKRWVDCTWRSSRDLLSSALQGAACWGARAAWRWCSLSLSKYRVAWSWWQEECYRAGTLRCAAKKTLLWSGLCITSSQCGCSLCAGALGCWKGLGCTGGGGVVSACTVPSAVLPSVLPDAGICMVLLRLLDGRKGSA